MWVVAQGWIGGIFTGSGTDPNTGPLIIVLALAMTPAFVAAPYVGADPPRRGVAPARRMDRDRSGCGRSWPLFLSALYPVAPAQSSDSAMSGMSGMTGMTGDSGSMATGASTASCTGTNHSGLDVTNSPLMQMAGPGTDDEHERGRRQCCGGAQLDEGELALHRARLFLRRSPSSCWPTAGTAPDQIHMAKSGCANEPTFSEQIKATQYVQATSQAVARYTTPAAAAGRRIRTRVSPTDYPIVYYVNPTIVRSQSIRSNRTLDPSAVDGLVYATTPSGEQVLAAAMYLLPVTLAQDPPMPYGSLVQWHQRTGSVCPRDRIACRRPWRSPGSPRVRRVQPRGRRRT